LSYEGGEPEKTQSVVKNITDIFIERNVQIQNQETADAIAFIEEQLKVYKGKIKSAEIVQLEDELNDLLLDSTEKHPLVKQFREQISVKRAELDQEKLEYTENITLDTKTTSPIISEIKKALDSLDPAVKTKPTANMANMIAGGGTEPDIYKVMLIDKLDNVMARDVHVNESIYNMLLQRLETAKITQRLNTSKEGTRYTILDPPRVPLHPFKPNKALIAFLGLFLGGVFGIGLVIAAEFLDKSFIDVEDAKNHFGVPLLGAISKINTVDTLRQVKEKQRWLYSMTFVSGVVVVIITMTISTLIR
jgi:LPS O-antigen subunit length determinant protein (WzzB/FepE family)